MAHLHQHDHHCESCSHEHHHEHNLKEQVWLIGITVVLLIAAVLIEKYLHLATWQLLLVFLVPYLVIGHDTLKEAAEGLLHGDAFKEHFLPRLRHDPLGYLLLHVQRWRWYWRLLHKSRLQAHRYITISRPCTFVLS